MSRLETLSPTTLAELYKQESSDTLVTLLTILDAETGEVLQRLADNFTQRLVGVEYANPEDLVYGIVSRGENYVFLPLEITLPSDDISGSSRAQLVIRDATRYITPLVRSLQTPPIITLEIVLKSQPDIVEISFSGFYLSSITYSADQVSGELTLVDYQVEPFPVHGFTPSYFPGLF
jgi:hypothetical protein